MPGVNVSFFFVGFQLDERGHAFPAFEPQQASTIEEAVSAATELAKTYSGAIAWTRPANPAIGELGPPVVVFSRGKTGDFG